MKNNSIKKVLLSLGIALCFGGITHAQTIVSYRYWFDANIAAATAVSVTATQDVNLSASLSAGSLGIGYHTITTQFKDANGRYSSPFTRSFVKTGSNITAYDYWWDAHYANHTLVNVNAAQTIDLQTAITPYNLDTGQHLFAIRFKDVQGNWSVPLQDTVRTTLFISGIRELASVSNISLYPNPTHSGSSLKFEGNDNEVLNMTLSDAFGKTVQQQQLQNGFAVQQYQVKTEELAAGVYLLKLSSAKGSSTMKLVVQ